MEETLEQLNKFLLEQGGRSIDGKQMYRLVWSDDCWENRFGTFREFIGNIFLREFTGVRKTPKYNYIKERYIFEKWAPGSITAHPETPDASSGDYIPVFVFENAQRNYLDPNRKVLTFLLNYMKGQIKKDDEIPQELLDEKEVQQMIDSMDVHPSFSTHGATRDSVAYTKEIKDKWPLDVQ